MAIETAFAMFYVAAQVIERFLEVIKERFGWFESTKAEITISDTKIEKLKEKIDGTDDSPDKEKASNGD